MLGSLLSVCIWGPFVRFQLGHQSSMKGVALVLQESPPDKRSPIHIKCKTEETEVADSFFTGRCTTGRRKLFATSIFVVMDFFSFARHCPSCSVTVKTPESLWLSLPLTSIPVCHGPSRYIAKHCNGALKTAEVILQHSS